MREYCVPVDSWEWEWVAVMTLRGEIKGVRENREGLQASNVIILQSHPSPWRCDQLWPSGVMGMSTALDVARSTSSSRLKITSQFNSSTSCAGKLDYDQACNTKYGLGCWAKPSTFSCSFALEFKYEIKKEWGDMHEYSYIQHHAKKRCSFPLYNVQ